MTQSKLRSSLIALVAFCTIAGTSFAFPKILRPSVYCPSLNGSYAFYFWDPDSDLAASGVFDLQANEFNALERICLYEITSGDIRCNTDGLEFLSEIITGSVSIPGGEGTMWVETASDEICGLQSSIEFDVAAVNGGSTILFNTNGSEFVSGNTNLPNAGFGEYFRGRADNGFAPASRTITGCYNLSFWVAGTVGNCSLCIEPPSSKTRIICPQCGPSITGDCHCNSDGLEVSSTITNGSLFLESDGEGFIEFESSTNPICGDQAWLGLDIAIANSGKEILGNCNGLESLNSGTTPNSGYDLPCAVEGYLY